MKKAGMGLAALVLLSWFSVTHAADAPGAKLKEELAKQEKIYRGEIEELAGGYTVDRGLKLYAHGLSADFDRALASLGPRDRWLDIGAGEGRAMLDYFHPAYDIAHPEHRGAKAQAVAMSIENRTTPQWLQTAAKVGPEKMRYLADKRLLEYSPEELGRFQVITDVIGGFSYTRSLSEFMEKVLGLLEPNGSFFTVLQDIQREDGKSTPHYAGSPFLTTLKDLDGSDLNICTWLKRISCVEVTCEPKEWKPPMESFRIRKVCEKVDVPALSLVRYEAGTPPEREYKVTRGTLTAAKP